MEVQMWIIEILRRALIYGTPLLLGTLGEIYTERSGVLNLGIEGMMIVGAFIGFITTIKTGNPWLGLLLAGAVGVIASSIHAFLSITLRVIQVVSGLALTFFGLGLTAVLGKSYEGQTIGYLFPKIT